MLSTMNKVKYTVFGLSIQSEIQLPEVPQQIHPLHLLDVDIIIGDVPVPDR